MVSAWYVPRYVAAGGKPWFYQQEFGAAAMQACGFGYVNPDASSRPQLTAFLERRADGVSCHDLQGLAQRPLSSMQRAFRYLMMTVAETWQLRGAVSWSGLLPLYCLLYGITIVLAYAVFRQAMNRPLAIAAALLLAVSTLHLNNLPHLRDYAKAPFVLALVLFALRLVCGPVTWRRSLLLATGAGLVTGVGIGFRNDLLVAIPAMAAVFALFRPGPIREQLAMRAASVAVYGLAVYVAMFPMSSVYKTGGGGSTPHLILLGLTPEFSAGLGVDNSRLYELGFEYRDELALAIIDNYSDRRLGDHRFLEMYGADYDRAAGRLLSDYAREFPADLLARVYASAVRITQLPYLESTAAVVVPDFVPEPWKGLLLLKTKALRWLGAWWPWPLFAGVTVLGTLSPRIGLFSMLGIAYLSGYPALQFQERHIFHLEFVSWLVLGVAVMAVLRGTRAMAQPAERARVSALLPERPVRSFAVFLATAAALVIAAIAPLGAARQYQAAHVTALLKGVVSAPRTDIAAQAQSNGDTSVFAVANAVDGLPIDGGIHARYVVAELGGAACDALRIDLTQRYRAASAGYDFSHRSTIDVPLIDTPTQVVFPAYFRNPRSSSSLDEPMAFSALELPASQAACVQRVSYLAPPVWPALLDLRLPPDWERVTPYATISGVEGRQNPAKTYTVPDNLSRGAARRALTASPTFFSEQDILKVSPTFAMRGPEWRVDGVGGVGGRGPLLYLVEMKPRHLEKGTAFIAEGTIEKGGVTFGLVADDEWKVQLHLRQTGDFSVVIVAPDTRDYKVVFANNLVGMSLHNRVVVRRAGLVSPKP